MAADEVRRIVCEPGADPVESARKARSAGSTAQLCAAAIDRALAPRARAVALLAVAEQCAVSGEAIDESVLDAVEDPAVVSAAIAAGIPQALTGALAAAPDDPVTTATRKLVAALLEAEGGGGLALASLLAAAGDSARAGAHLAREFLENINDFEDIANPDRAAWVAVAGALAGSNPDVFNELCARIAAESAVSLDLLGDRVAAASTLPDPVRQAAADAIERARLVATI